MKAINLVPKQLIFVLFGILFYQFCLPQNPTQSEQIFGEWKYESHIYRNVGRYGPKEVDSIKSSLLYFTKDKVYFTDIKFIDTCFYLELHFRAFFDRVDKESSYFQDGPLAVNYLEEQLSKFVRLDLNSKHNSFGTFYLNVDTLILNSFGGVTFFFTKVP